jgi:uncharacterized membrane protein (DUF2068 family)
MEIYEVVVHYRLAKVVVLLVNVLIVFYLVAQLRKTRRTPVVA